MAGRRMLHTPAVLAWLRLMRVFHKVSRRANEQVSQVGLSSAQFYILANVGATEGITQQEMAEALHVTQGNICQLLDKMEAAGLLVRRRQGRKNHLYLTDMGHSLFAKLVPEHEAFIAKQFSGLTTEKQVQLHRLLRGLDRSLNSTSKG